MGELTKDIEKHLRHFQQIRSKVDDNEHNNKEISSLLSHLKISNENLRENEKKTAEQIKLLREICNEQASTISGLYDIEKKNEVLVEENFNRKNLIKKLEDKIIEVEGQLNKREKGLQEKIEVLQATFDLQIHEKENEKINLKKNFDHQLSEATEKEQNLKNEIYKLNNQWYSSTAVLQKKILELEQKLKNSEREKSMYNISQGNFVSANVLKNYSNQTRATVNNISENQTQNRNPPSIIRNVAQNIESNTSKKFQFRKTNHSNENLNKKLVNQSLYPSEMSKQMNTNMQQWKQNNNSSRQMTVNSANLDDIIEENSEDINGSLLECKEEVSKISENENELQFIFQSNKNIVQENQKNIVLQSHEKVLKQNEKNQAKFISPSVTKKRRMFNPKNMDYLE